jgi:phosphate-selective porin OprO and OprP
MFVLSGAVYQPRKNNTSNFGNAVRSDRLGASARLTFVPVHSDDMVFHLGVVGRFQSVNNNRSGANAWQQNLFWTSPEIVSRHTSAANSIVNTGALRARSYNVVAGEALGIWGPAHAEGGYYQANVQQVPTSTATSKNPRFHGYHIQAGYVLTGETRGYDFATGTLRNPTPSSKCGAWEIAARYSFIDLIDKNVYGGSEHNTTVGLNWFVNEHVRIAANYTRANIRATGTGTIGTGTSAFTSAGFQPATTTAAAKRDLDIFGLRLGVMF